MKALFGERNYIFNHLSTKYDALYMSLTTSNVLSIMRARTDNVDITKLSYAWLQKFHNFKKIHTSAKATTINALVITTSITVHLQALQF